METRSEFSGGLRFISLPDIFQILGGNNATGTLQITTKYAPNPGKIYFVDGEPINASLGPLHGVEAIYALFGWTEGEFEFHKGKKQVGRIIKGSRMQITLDALRMLDDGMIEKVGPPASEGSIVRVGGLEINRNNLLSANKGPLIDYTYVIDEEYFRDGEIIVREGAHGNWIWVILEGMVNIIRETSNGPVTVARLREGCFIGTLVSLLHGENTRTATVAASGDVQLGLLDTQRLSAEFASLSPEFRGLLYSLAGRLGKITDSTLSLFLKDHEMDTLTNGKEVIIQKGSSKDELFTIVEGETYVVGETSKGDVPLLTLQKKDVFGSLPFMDFGHEPRSAAVLATKDLKVDKLDPESLQREFNRLSGTFKNLIFDLGTCVSVTTGLACRM